MYASWIIHNALVAPSAFALSPAFCPASNSGWPTCIKAPRLAEDSKPEFIVITGTPAATAALIAGPNASGSGKEITIPSGWVAAAAWIELAISAISAEGL